MSDTVERCEWPQAYDDLLDYHDDEWGRPPTDQHRLFEKICLEGFQSGLSWLTILRKREAFREAFAGFDFEEVAGYGDAEDRLLANPGIIRNRRKIEATINNAKRACKMVESEGSLVDWIWAWAVEAPNGRRRQGVPACRLTRSGRRHWPRSSNRWDGASSDQRPPMRSCSPKD